MNKEIDQYLLQLKNGDKSAISLLYDATCKPLYTLCYSYLKNKHDALKTERKWKVQESKNKSKNKAADRRAKNAEKLQKHLEKIGADIDAVIADIVQWRNGK